MNYPLKSITAGTVFIFFLFTHIWSQSNDENYIFYHLIKADQFLEEMHYDSAQFHYSLIIERGIDEVRPELFGSVTNKYVTTLYRQEDYFNAQNMSYRNLNRCIDLWGKEHPETALCYLNLGILCFLSSHTGIAHEYYVRALDIYDKIYGPENENSATVYEWMGIYHNGFSDSVSARKYLWEALKLRVQLDQVDDFHSAELFRYMGLFYKRYGIFDSAFYCFNKAKTMFDKRFSEFNFQSVKCLNNISDIYEWLGQYDTVKALHNKNLYLLDNLEAKNRYTRMMTYYNLAEFYRKIGDINNALTYIQKVLKLYFPEIDENNLLDNPDDISQNPYTIPKISLLFKASCLKDFYKEDTINRSDYLISAARCYALAHEIIRTMYSRITNIEELIFVEHMHSTLYIAMAENAFLVNRITGDQKYLSDALTYLSINRSANMAFNDEAIQNKFQELIPDSYIQIKNKI